MAMARRIVPDRCAGIIVDFQDFFLAQLDKSARPKIKANTKSFARLLGYFKIPIIVTLERPVEHKGAFPKEIGRSLGREADVFEKDYFDLTKERRIKEYLGRLNRKQIIMCGCETDVCVLQSCLGLLVLGYEVYVVEDLLFSSSCNVESAILRMRAADAVFLSYKTLYYELLEAVEGGRHAEKLFAALGPMPEDLANIAFE